MNIKEKVAITDELLVRMLYQVYGAAHERGLDMEAEETFALLVTGCARFLAHLGRSNGYTPEQIARLAQQAAEQPVPVTAHGDPAVRRWIEQFTEVWGESVPYAVLPSLASRRLQ